MTQTPSQTILSQLEDLPKPEQWWWVRYSSDGAVECEVHEGAVYICAFVSVKSARTKATLHGLHEVLPMDFRRLAHRYAGIVAPELRIACAGFAICDADGNVLEWRKW